MKSEAEPDKTLVVSPRVTAREMSSGAVLMDLTTGDCWELNSLGAEIWKALVAGYQLPAVVEQLAAECAVPRSELETDVLRLVEDLKRNGLLEVKSL